MIIDCAHYQDGRRLDEGPVSLQDAAARCDQGGFVWLGLFEPGEAELAQVRDTFGLHELAVEDAQSFHMRPKIESYDQDVRLVILRTARYDDRAEEVEFGEISVFLAPTFVITVRQGVASELRGARQRLEQRPELLSAGTSSALWAILDQVVDGYAPVVAGLDGDIDQLEAMVFSGTAAPTERIYSLRREVTDFYRAVHPLLGVVTTIQRVFLPLTFVTGFFGQNFRWLVGDISTPLAFFVYGLGGLAVPLGLLFLWLRRRRKHPTPAPAMRVAAMDGDR